MSTIDIDDTDEAQRLRILQAMLAEAARDGWTHRTLTRAAQQAGLSHAQIARGDLYLLFPEGIRDVLRFWSQTEDIKMATTFRELTPQPERIREKITWLVRQRLDQMLPSQEAVRRASATLALPTHAELGTRLAWGSADAMWRALKDQTTDFNYYTKRSMLAGIYIATLAVWLGEDANQNTHKKRTWRFLDDRIENVMQIEKLKGRIRDCTPNSAAILSRLSALRFGRQQRYNTDEHTDEHTAGNVQ